MMGSRRNIDHPQWPAISPNRRRLLASLAGLPLLASCTGTRSLGTLDILTPSGAYRLERDAAYGPASRQRVDVYRPEGEARTALPIVVFFYGGSWRRGEKGDYRFVGEFLSRNGVVAVVADYRLFPDVTFPSFVEDGAAAFAWARANAAMLGGTPDRVFMIGHSAGAHIAALAALDPRFLAAHELTPRAVAGVVGLAGPYDIDLRRLRWLERVFAGSTTPEEATPLAQARAGAPPMLLLNGESDRLVAPRNAEAMAARLVALGNRAEARIYPGIGHLDIVLGLSTTFGASARAVRDDILAFITA
jgi:acetyl esterase/lipase